MSCLLGKTHSATVVEAGVVMRESYIVEMKTIDIILCSNLNGRSQFEFAIGGMGRTKPGDLPAPSVGLQPVLETHGIHEHGIRRPQLVTHLPDVELQALSVTGSDGGLQTILSGHRATVGGQHATGVVRLCRSQESCQYGIETVAGNQFRRLWPAVARQALRIGQPDAAKLANANG